MKKRETVIFLPGLCIGTDRTLYYFLEVLRRSLKQEYLRVFIYTWKDDENDEWSGWLEKDLTRRNGIIPHVFRLPINHESIQKFYKDFYSLLNLPYQGTVPSTTFKRTIPFFLYHRGINYIKEILSDVYNIDVIKIRSAMRFFHEQLKERVPDFYEKLHKDWQHQFSPTDLQYVDKPNDILYSTKVSSSLVDEIVYTSSLATLSKIFEPDYDKFMVKLSSYFKKFIEVHKSVYKVHDVHTFDILHSMPNTTPLEGGSIFHHLINSCDDKLLYTSDPNTLSNMGIAPFLVGVPTYGVEEGEVVKTSNADLLRQNGLEGLKWIIDRSKS